jgi:6-phosphogluconate dehydrogenase
MGANIARRLMRGGHDVMGFDSDAVMMATLAAEGATVAQSIGALVTRMETPRIFWVMLPAGFPTESTIQALISLAAPGDVIIDGGNSFYKDDIRRAKLCASSDLHYVDVGTSGGVSGLECGYCLMMGGDAQTINHLDPIFTTLAPGYGALNRTPGRNGPNDRVERGYIHVGPAGSGHFVKMVHNGIEYGLMQAYAEGFDILRGRASEKLTPEERYDIDVADVAEVWRRGSVISSWLLDICASALTNDPQLADYSGHVFDSGEGQWTIEAAMEEAVPANVLSAALFARYRSRLDTTYSDKLLSAMRLGFGGHVEAPQ